MLVLVQLMGVYLLAAIVNYIPPIQNLRYQLVLIPLMIMLVQRVIAEEPIRTKGHNRRLSVLLAFLLTGCFLKETLLGLKYGIRGDVAEIIDGRGSSVFRSIQWFRENGDKHAGAILAFRPAEIGFYLTDYRIVCPDDPEMMPIYQESEPFSLIEKLREMKVAYVISDFGRRNFYVHHSLFRELLRDTNLFEAVFSSGKYTIFRLKERIVG